MTREGAIKHAEIIKAFQEGKTIQWRSNIDGTWSDIHSPPFHEDYQYRVKPEPRQPREWWINLYPDGAISLLPTQHLADKYTLPIRVECIHVREVIDEEGA